MRQHPALALLAAAAACLGIATGAAPSSARLVAAEPLAAVTTITASSSGTASVVLYDDATVSAAYAHNPDVTLSGKGRLVGFDLVSATYSAGGSNDDLTAERLPAFAGSATYVSGSYGAPAKCSGYPNDTVPVQQQCSGCSYYPSPTVPVEASCDYATPKTYTLHEGYYQLRVLTDGAPLRITIKLHGLGKTHAKVHLQAPFRSLETPMTQRESIGSSTITYGGSASFANATDILTIVSAKVHANATLVAATGCWRSDTSAPPPYAYSPACPGGHVQGYAYRINAPAGGVGAQEVAVFAGSLTPTNPPNGVGGSIADSDGPAYVGGLAVWVDGPQLPFFTPFTSY
ncbi:MAG: hypothetical protein QOD07_1640 [Frankiaceae bacterium]|jgi:hypothetical protein|nr:hypothetical protein [Frankiaceae bacterium]